MPDELEFEEVEEQETPSPDGDIKALRAAAKRGAETLGENAALKREMAFMKAGVSTESALGQLAMKGYDGDLDPDTIKAYMTSLGVGTAPVEPSTPEISDAEKLATQQRQALGSGAGTPSNDPPPTEEPSLQGLQEFQKARAAGATAEEASTYFFDHMFAAAQKGDDRVLISGRKGGE